MPQYHHPTTEPTYYRKLPTNNNPSNLSLSHPYNLRRILSLWWFNPLPLSTTPSNSPNTLTLPTDHLQPKPSHSSASEDPPPNTLNTSTDHPSPSHPLASEQPTSITLRPNTLHQKPYRSPSLPNPLRSPTSRRTYPFDLLPPSETTPTTDQLLISYHRSATDLPSLNRPHILISL